MLGLPKKEKVNKAVAPIIRDADHRRAHLNKNSSVLKTTMIGPHMILIPRPEHGGGADWPESVPNVD
jgi:hypothetical protein